MRKINPRDFTVATRTTSRDINRRIALNIIRENQPLSRADLARSMKVSRGVASVLVHELIREGVVYEGTTGEANRGRKPTFLHIRTHDRLIIAVDVRFSKTYLMLADFAGDHRSIEIFDTIFDIPRFIDDLAARVRRLLKSQNAALNCEGLGIVVPGMVDLPSGRVLNAPALGWRDADIKDKLSKAVGLPVHIENSGRACALAQLWMQNGSTPQQNFVYVNVSDGVGVGIVVNGELVRGHNFVAGEFGHMPLSMEGPLCLCGSRGCWEAYVSNLATTARYFGHDLSKVSTKDLASNIKSLSMADLIGRARTGDGKAMRALLSTARFMGLGLSAIINILNPDVIFLAGEIIDVWDLLEDSVMSAIEERVLTERSAKTRIQLSTSEHPRLRGAAALLAAPAFAAPRVA
jgi:N-acetylglucosamine repressor